MANQIAPQPKAGRYISDKFVMYWRQEFRLLPFAAAFRADGIAYRACRRRATASFGRKIERLGFAALGAEQFADDSLRVLRIPTIG
jgi:hypothetical protein